MRTCRFTRQGTGAATASSRAPRSARSPAAPWDGGLPEGPRFPFAEVTLLAPVLPTKVVCVGRNYRAHAKELGNEVPKEPLLFIKPSTAVIGPMQEIRIPEASKEVHHEAELAAVIGRTAHPRRTPSRRARPSSAGPA